MEMCKNLDRQTDRQNICLSVFVCKNIIAVSMYNKVCKFRE